MICLSRRQVLATAALLGAGLLAGCAPPNARGRMLPSDRSATILYVALGDSSVAGVGTSRPEWNYVNLLHRWLRSVYPKTMVQNLGVSGAMSADVARDQVGPAVAARPQLITLSVGPNDITQGREVQEYETNLDTIIGTLARDTGAVIITSLVPDLGVAPRFRGEEKVRFGRQAVLFNEAIRRVGGRYGIELVDLYTTSQQEVPANPGLVSADAYHPSDAGYARWAELMWQRIEAKIPPA